MARFYILREYLTDNVPLIRLKLSAESKNVPESHFPDKPGTAKLNGRQESNKNV